MKKYITFLFTCLIAITTNLFAQTTGDYRSASTGNWYTANTWETYDGAAWVATAVIPNAAHGIITIRSPHTVTLNIGNTIDQVNVETGATFLISGGTINLNGASSIVCASGSIFNWSGGFMGGTGGLDINAGATFNTSSASNHSILGLITINNSGTWDWTGADISTGGFSGASSATINNYGTLNINTNADMATGNSNAVNFTNQTGGVINKTGSTSDATTFGGNFFSFTSQGALNINSGKIQLNTSSAHSGPVFIAAGAILSLPVLDASFNAGSTFSGSGSINVEGAVAFINTPIVSAITVNLSAGKIAGSSNLTIDGTSAFNWSGGTLEMNAALNINANAAFSMTANTHVMFANQVINNYGTWNWSNGEFISSGGQATSINNYGTWNISGCASLRQFTVINFGTSGITNSGILNISTPAIFTANSNMSPTNFSFTNALSGVINILSCGSLSTRYVSCFNTFAPVCSGTPFNIPYTSPSNLNAGNVFTAQLSDATGSFATSQTIGTIASTVSGTITATVPTSTPAGTNYRIRVVSSNPALEGIDNGTNISVLSSTTYYPDADGDGYGAASNSVQACTQPANHVTDNTDCNDANAAVHALQQFFIDGDNDGFGSSAAAMLCETTPPAGYSANNTDCDDSNAGINPNATEICNGIDDNCNGLTDDGATPPVSNAGSDQTLCTTGTTLAGNNPTAGTGTWTVIAGSGNFANANLYNTAVSGLSTGINTFRWTVNASPCLPAFDDVSVTVNTPPTGTISANNTNICINSAVGISITAASAYGLSSVTVSNGLQSFTQTKSGTSATGTFSFTMTTAGTYNFIVTVVDINCTAFAVDTVIVTVNALPATPASGAITGPTAVCMNQTGMVYSVTPLSGAASYNWVVPAGMNITGGINTNTITVSTTSSFNSGIVKVRGVNICGNGAFSPNYNVTKINATPTKPAPINGNSGTQYEICGGDIETFTTSQANSTSFVWQIPSGATFQSGQGTNTVSVLFPSGFSSGTITVAVVNCVGTGQVRSLSLKSIPGPVGAPGINGPNEDVCPGTTQTYSLAALPPGATSVQWVLTGGGTLLTGQGTTSITVLFPSPYYGLVEVFARGVNSCGSMSSWARKAIYSNHNKTLVITGSNIGCPSTSQSYSLTTTYPSGTPFTWTAPAGASISSGQGTSSVTVNFSSSFTTGTLSAYATNVCGAGPTKTFAITSVPAKPGNINGPTNGVCPLTAHTYSISAVAGATSYTWTVPGSTLTTSNPSVSMTSGSSLSSYTLSVVASNSCGSGLARTLTINSVPVQPVKISGPSPVCPNALVNYAIAPVPSATSYIWTCSGNSYYIISDGIQAVDYPDSLTTTSTSVTYSIDAIGTRTISVRGVNSCGNGIVKSKNISLSSSACRLSGEGEVAAEDFSVYPNPAHDKVTVSIDVKEATELHIQLIDITGRIVHSENFSSMEGMNLKEMDVRKISPGVYFLLLNSNNISQKVKLTVE